MKYLEIVGNIGQTNHTFDEMYISDPTSPYRGNKFWDGYFTRVFRDGIRPVDELGMIVWLSIPASQSRAKCRRM